MEVPSGVVSNHSLHDTDATHKNNSRYIFFISYLL